MSKNYLNTGRLPYPWEPDYRLPFELGMRVFWSEYGRRLKIVVLLPLVVMASPMILLIVLLRPIFHLGRSLRVQRPQEAALYIESCVAADINWIATQLVAPLRTSVRRGVRSPAGVEPSGRRRWNPRAGMRLTNLRPSQTTVALSERITRRLWIVAMLDMVMAAWMIAAGDWFDGTSRLTSVITLGGHHELVLIMAAVGFVMLAGLAVRTAGFTSVSRLEIRLITIGGTISVVALAGVLLPVLLLAFAALLLGAVIRLLIER